MAEKVYLTNSFEETQKLGEELAKTLRGGEILALHGDLGSGKTTFVQGIAKGLGIVRRIISPTFIIMRHYKTRLPVYSSSERSESRSYKKDGSSRQARTINFYHIDLYRIETRDDIKGLGIEEILKDPESIVAIEWPEKMGEMLPENHIDIYFEYLENDKRKILIKY